MGTIKVTNSFLVGESVTISNIVSGGPGSYDGTFTLLTATSTQFTYNLGSSNPGTETSVTGATVSGWVATVTTANSFVAGQTVSITGVGGNAGPGTYNGTVTLLSPSSPGTSFTYALLNNPGGSATTFGAVNYNTITVTASNTFTTGSVVVAGIVGATALNGTFPLVSANSGNFTYIVPANPLLGTAFGTATVNNAVTEGGTTTTEGYLTDSADGESAGIAGYEQTPGGTTSGEGREPFRGRSGAVRQR